jgi:hypothetical protein
MIKIILTFIFLTLISGCGAVNPRIVRTFNPGGAFGTAAAHIQVDTKFDSIGEVVRVARAYCKSLGLESIPDPAPSYFDRPPNPLMPVDIEQLNWREKDKLTENAKMQFAISCGPAIKNTNEYKNIPLNTGSQNSSMSIDQAKQHCKDLGFKPTTEKFGNCVLELSK